MIRRIIDFTLILLFMWACMLIGLWLINEVIVPLEIPGINNRVLTATLKVAASAGLALLWLWLWREIVKRTFWRTLRAYEQSVKMKERVSSEKEKQKGRNED